MTLETSAQSFEDQIVNHKARIIEVIKHKTLDHKVFDPTCSSMDLTLAPILRTTTLSIQLLLL